MTKSEKIAKELRDFNHYTAADYIEFLQLQLDSLREDFLDAQVEAWYEGSDAAYAYDPYNPPKNPYREAQLHAAIQELLDLDF